MKQADLHVGDEVLIRVAYKSWRRHTIRTLKRVTVAGEPSKGVVRVSHRVMKPTNLKRFSPEKRSRAIFDGKIKFKPVIETFEVATRSIVGPASSRAREALAA